MLQAMLRGSVTSLEVFFLTLLFALPLALPFCAGRMAKNKILSNILKAFLLVIRGTPLMLQLLVVYFGPSLLCLWFNNNFGTDFRVAWPRFFAAIVALIVNYAAYFAEIYRGGFNSIDKGQYEAAYSLGFTHSQTLSKIVIPQMFRIVIPPISNEVITLIKDTALASTIALAEMMKVAQGMVNRDGTLVPYVLAAGIYLVFTFVMTIALGRAEVKYSQY